MTQIIIFLVIGAGFAIGVIEFAVGMWIGRWLYPRQTRAEVAARRPSFR